MLPGKKYTPDDFLRILWKRRWFIVIPLLVVASTTAVVAMFLPDRYRASTSIIIVPQRVPENFVRSTVTAELSERLNLISQQILSRTRLERIIQEFNLYESQRARLIMEDVIEGMRKDISLNVNSNRNRAQASSFNVSFESPDARTAMRVTERLASLFVQENLEDRELLADQTNQFLQVQLEDARRKLIEKENALKDFRQRNNGVLPDQVQSNLQMMSAAQMQLQSLAESVNRDQDRLTIIERNYADATSAAAPIVMAAPVQTSNEPFVGTAAQQLEIARANLRTLELRLRPEHPDIGRAKRIIVELEAKTEAEALQQPLSAQTPSTIVVDKVAQARLENMRNDIQELRQRIASGKRETARLQEVAQGHAARVQAAPGLEAQLTELMRDYNTLQESYTSLLKKSQDSNIAVNLERRQIGEQFRILDGARLPERPVSPNRLQINLLGILAGLALGVGLVALLEYKDTSFKTDDDIVTTLALPVLAVIPAMTNASERRAHRRRKMLWAASASIGCMALVVAVMVVWRLKLVEAWLR